MDPDGTPVLNLPNKSIQKNEENLKILTIPWQKDSSKRTTNQVGGSCARSSGDAYIGDMSGSLGTFLSIISAIHDLLQLFLVSWNNFKLFPNLSRFP